MSLRSLRASIAGQQRAKQSMKRKGWTQNYLAIEAGLSTRNSVWKFLSGRPVDRNIFMELCFQLDLDWQDVADLDVFEDDADGAETEPTITDADNLTAENLTIESLKSQLKKHFEDHDSIITSPFNFTQQFKLAEIYTIPNHLAQLSAQQWLEVSDLESSLLSNQSIKKDTSGAISIVETVSKHSRLLILGKSGSGKTLLLKFLAQQCFAEKLFADRLPIYFSLQDLLFYSQHHPDWTIKNFIGDRLASLGNQSDKKDSLTSFDFDGFEKILLLIDGLDEIPYGQRDSILNQMRGLLNDNPNLSVVLTSRMTAHIPLFQGVKIVELADFSWEQIQHYVQKRFSFLSDQEDQSNDQNKSATFLELLRRPDHRLILNLAKTPILLELICCTFQERLTFPKRVTKLYQEGLEILLRRSQQTQHFQADSFYRELPLSEKFKLLGCLATNLLEQGQFYIEKADIVTIIYQYLQENFGEQLNRTDLLLRSENVLSAIQLQHGLLVEQAKNIFSFSHLTFQEYLAARYLVNSFASTDQPDQLDQLMAIAKRIEDPRWLEVIRLMLALLPTADQFLGQLKRAIDHTVWTNPVLSPLLTVLNQKADAIQSPYPPAAVRSFYFGLLFVRDLNLVSLIVRGMVANLYPDMALDLYLVRLYEQVTTFTTEDRQADALINLALAFDLENRFTLSPPLKSGLRELRLNLVDALQGTAAVTDWWQSNGDAWQQTLTDLLREQRQLPLGVNLTPELQQQLQQYYTNNIFLLQCLNGDCRVTATAKDQLVSEILTVSVAESA